ncbi:MAG: hypothetical protein IE931_08625 [Sphingobacteriales bacterium]|nr:hypothetical protein [Sphingobacteriales bacterium]
MKKLIFSGFMATALFFTVAVKAQSNIPDAVKAALTKAYPTVKSIHWDEENGNYEAGFKANGKEMSVLLDAKGSILETETAISVKELPSGVSSYLKSKFGEGYKISESAMIVKANGHKTFEAEVKGKDYLFDTAGKFIKSVKE